MDLLLGNILVVLCWKYNCLKSYRLSCLIILYWNLCLSVRTKVCKCAVFSNLCELECKLVSECDWVWHVLLSLICSISKHHSLISGSGVEVVCKVALFCLVNSHGDISRLLVDWNHYCTWVSVESLLSVIISDLKCCFSDDCRNIKLCLCGNLSCYKDEACTACCLTCDTAHRVLLYACIKDGIWYCIAELIRMSLSYWFWCK